MTIFDRLRGWCYLNPAASNTDSAGQNTSQGPSSTSTAAENISRDNPAVASTSRSFFSVSPSVYCPAQKYRLDTLLAFTQSEDRYSGNLVALANDLANSLSTQKLNQRQRFEVSETLARLLPAGITVNYLGNKRGDTYFASLAVDAYLADEKMANIPALKAKFVAVLDRWLNIIAPDRMEFSIQGVNLQRVDVNNWLSTLRNPVAIQTVENQSSRTRSQQRSIGGIMGRLMYGQQGDRNQSVHDQAIKSIGTQVLQKLNKELKHETLTPVDALRGEVIQFARSSNATDWVSSGLDHIFTHNEKPSRDSEVNTTPILALQALWSYAKQHKDPKVRENLMQATRICVTEIGQENPCSTGCVERILNVPNGIDPVISMIATDIHYADEVSRLAARVQSAMPSIFEGTELENPDMVEGLDEAVFGEIKASLFKRAAETELGLVRSVPERQFVKEVERMLPGFTL